MRGGKTAAPGNPAAHVLGIDVHQQLGRLAAGDRMTILAGMPGGMEAEPRPRRDADAVAGITPSTIVQADRHGPSRSRSPEPPPGFRDKDRSGPRGRPILTTACALDDAISAAATAPARIAIFMLSPPYPGAPRAQDSARPDEFLKIKCGRNVKVGLPATEKCEGFHTSFAEIAGAAIPSGIMIYKRLAGEPLGFSGGNGIGAILLTLASSLAWGPSPVRRTCPP